jgi:hypothetical protein
MEISYEIYLLGLTDPSRTGRTRFVTAMERLTGQPGEEFEGPFPSSSEPAFKGLEQDRAQMVADSLGESGVLIEVRPRVGVPPEPEEEIQAAQLDAVAADRCPSCDHLRTPGAVECESCGLVFAKWEREKIVKMQQERSLEEALTKALQVREEWVQRAKKYLETHPFPEDGAAGFNRVLVREEVPFLRLQSDEGPILMTSRRMIALVGEIYHSIPYELVGDVDFGGGLVIKKNKVRLLLTFHSPLPLTSGEVVKSMSWQLDKDSSFYKDVIMDWAFARNFICGSCGERDLEYRTEVATVKMRCMHCATDHEVDMREAVAVPLITEV